MRFSTSSTLEVLTLMDRRPARTGPGGLTSPRPQGVRRLVTIGGLAARAIITQGREYPVFAAYLAKEVRAFLEDRVRLQRALVLDLGSGFGEFGRALQTAGAEVISLDRRPLGAPRQVVADARRTLPFRDGALDGVVCSNLLEHLASPPALVGELARVLRPGGWVYLSWTAWYAPLGGHEYSPWHYLGVRPARAIGRYLRMGQGHNVPGRELFPVHVGPTIRGIRRTRAFDIRFAGPRYWPGHTWMVKVPGVREVATWNCLLLLERRGPPPNGEAVR